MTKVQKIDRLQLVAQQRTVFGKKLKALRRQGVLPGNIYGEDIASVSVSVDQIPFSKIYRHAGETGVVYLNINKDELPVLIHQAQRHPITGKILHIDFRKVNLKKKIEANVPVHITGESEAVAKKGGVLLHLAETLTVEALPDKLPSSIEVDISSLTAIGSEIAVGNLTKNPDYDFKDEVEKVIVRVTEHKEEETAPQIEVTPAEVEGETPAEGESEAKTPATETPVEGEPTQTSE